MSNTPASHDGGLEVVVNEDGGVTIPASELARLGIPPGTHLRLVPETPDVPEQRSKRERRGGPSVGKLADAVPREVIDDLIQALDEAKAERRAFYGAEQ